MDRRAFLGTLTGALLAKSLVAEAQPAGKVFRIGILANVRPGPTEPGGGLWQAFIEGLQELGCVEGRNITIEWRRRRTVKTAPSASKLEQALD